MRHGAAGVWWPIRSSKPAGRGSPTVGRFDSFAAPFHDDSLRRAFALWPTREASVSVKARRLGGHMRERRWGRRVWLVAIAALSLLAVYAPAALADGSLEVGAAPNPLAIGGTATLDFSGTMPTDGANANGPYRYSVVYLVQPGTGPCPSPSEDADTRPVTGGDSGTSFDQQEPFGASSVGDYRACVWMESRDSADGTVQGDVLTATTVLTIKQGSLDFRVSVPHSVRVHHRVTVRVHAATDGVAQLFVTLMRGRKCPAQPDFDNGKVLFDGAMVNSGVPFDRKRTLKAGKAGRYVVCGYARTAGDSITVVAAPFKVRRH